MRKIGKIPNPQIELPMMEKFINEHSGEYKKKELWQKLPKKMTYQTFQAALNYLYDSHKVSIDADGKIGWIWNPELAKKYMKKKHLFWRNKSVSK